MYACMAGQFVFVTWNLWWIRPCDWWTICQTWNDWHQWNDLTWITSVWTNDLTYSLTNVWWKHKCWCIPDGYQPVSSIEIHRIKQLKHTTQVSIQSAFNHTSRFIIYNTIEISKKILILVMKIHKLGILLLQALDKSSTKKTSNLRIWSWLAQGIKLWSEIVNFPRLLILLNMKR
jgi:hypothetical protein